MGSFFSSGSKNTSTSSGDPTAIEAFNIAKPALSAAVTGGTNLWNEISANPAFSGQRVAGLNPFQTGSANTLGNFTSQFNPAAANAVGNLGFANLGAGMNLGGNAQDIFNRASMDPTQMILNTAGQYANNPFVDGLIDASGRDVTRNLFENQLPGIDRAAVGAGNLNSTRAGVESAIAQRGAADRLADLSSNIRSQFFGRGLEMGQNQFNQNLSNMLQANQGLSNAANFGVGNLGTANQLALSGFTQGQLAGDVFRDFDQSNLDANKAQFDEGLANRLAVLSQLTGTAQAGRGFSSGAGTTSGTATSSPSKASQLGSLISTGAQIAGLFSDRRMKENIVQIGKLESGLPIYRFEYKPEFKEIAGKGMFVGVMADEAEKLIPEAVGVHANGYKMVDYSKVR
jgi:hypothetical protein